MQNFGLNHIAVSINSEMKPFKQGYNVDFAQNLYTEPYMALVHEAAKTVGTVDVPIRYGEYDNGYCIMVFDTSQNHSIKKEDQWSPATTGGLATLKATFKEAPTRNLCIYVVLEYPQMYTVRRDRTVVIEEAPQKTVKKKM